MKKVLVFILAYNAERHITGVLDRLPPILLDNPHYTSDVIVIDDCSKDNTTIVAREHLKDLRFQVRLLRNAINQGYGGNQKLGYTYAINHGYDAVVMVHGDGQYPPEMIPDMVLPIVAGEVDAVFGSRMMRKQDALAGGMPKYKFVGNIVLTTVQNWMLGSHLTEFHTGFRAYSVAALTKIPFQYNSNVFHFDTDIIIQWVDNALTIKEIPIPTRYGDEVCHVNGWRYALDVMLSTLLSRVQRYGIFYVRKFDYDTQPVSYPDKTSFESSHSFALAQAAVGDKVVHLACDGHVADHLRERGIEVVDYDAYLPSTAPRPCKAEVDINALDYSIFEQAGGTVIMLLDVLERVSNPEVFLANLYNYCNATGARIVITTPNIAFFIQRIMLLLGQFNYGKRGTLDKTHTRLFTFGALIRLLGESGFSVTAVKGIPAPYSLALGTGMLATALLTINSLLIHISKTVFAYQIGLVAKPMPALDALLEQAIATGDQIR